MESSVQQVEHDSVFETFHILNDRLSKKKHSFRHKITKNIKSHCEIPSKYYPLIWKRNVDLEQKTWKYDDRNGQISLSWPTLDNFPTKFGLLVGQCYCSMKSQRKNIKGSFNSYCQKMPFFFYYSPFDNYLFQTKFFKYLYYSQFCNSLHQNLYYSQFHKYLPISLFFFSPF